LQLGSIEPVEVGKTLQKERRGTSGVSHTFALELAYIMEHFGDNSEADSKLILEVYLHGAQSLMLAASYAQRNRLYTETLWKTLVEHCLSGTKTTTPSAANASSEGARGFDGTMFGLLLESAALSGADLAKLVAQIPAGMQVEGLKPRLVAAVTDYKLKVQMHESSSAIAKREKLTLLRELAQRARRGMRYGALEEIAMEDVRSRSNAKEKARIPFQRGNSTSILSPSMRTVARSDHFVLNYSLPIR
jgi:vacuolar protein sorting-associated protein 41